MTTTTLQKNKYKTNKASAQKKVNPFIGETIIQKKLKIGASNDAYEIEADRVADQVVGMSNAQIQKQLQNPLVQRKCASCEEEEHIQKKSLAEGVTPLVQRKEATSGLESMASDSVSSIINSNKSSGHSMDNSTQIFMEGRFGTEFSNVRVHTDSNAQQLSKELNAQAFTVGNDVFFNEGKYNPNSNTGKHLLAHELTHTIQQKGVKANIQRLVRERSVTCSGYPASSPIFNVMNSTPDDAVQIIRAADAKAITLLNNTVSELSSIRSRINSGAEPTWPTFSDCMAQSMHIKLLVNPSLATSWRGTGPRTVNRIIRVYTNLKNILESGSARYSCIGTDCDANEDAYVMIPEPGYHIRLCSRFWNNLGINDRALVIIHEIAHHYYNTEDHGFKGIGSSHCLDQFVADINNLPNRYPNACHNNEVTTC